MRMMRACLARAAFDILVQNNTGDSALGHGFVSAGLNVLELNEGHLV